MFLLFLCWVFPLVGENLSGVGRGPVWYPSGIALDLPRQDTLYETADTALLFDAASGEILYARNIDSMIPPASLTKLVTISLGMEYMNKKGISLDQPVHISSNAWAIHAPPRSSLMFLGPEQDPTWGELLLGLSVDSGNDAAIAIAEAVAGDVTGFVSLMNELAGRLKMEHTVFHEPSGYSELNMTTARDFCAFLLWYLDTWPENLVNLHSVQSFAYPNKPGTKQIVQYNRNRLVKEYPGADGFKTGYIDESGYNLAFTAIRNGLRLGGVILGGKNERARSLEAAYLLDEGFTKWEERWLEIPGQSTIRSYNAEKGTMATNSYTARVLLPRELWGGIKTGTTLAAAIRAPWNKNVPVGAVDMLDPAGELHARISLFLGNDLQEANVIQRIAEDVCLWLGPLSGLPVPLSEAMARKQYGPVLNQSP